MFIAHDNRAPCTAKAYRRRTLGEANSQGREHPSSNCCRAWICPGSAHALEYSLIARSLTIVPQRASCLPQQTAWARPLLHEQLLVFCYLIPPSMMLHLGYCKPDGKPALHTQRCISSRVLLSCFSLPEQNAYQINLFS